jgi:hypothetical protein
MGKPQTQPATVDAEFPMVEFADRRRIVFKAMRNGERDKADGVVGLAREIADALGRLTVQHLQLARLEIKADLRAMGLQAGLIAVLAGLGTVGYGLTMAGLALLLDGGAQGGIPLLIIGSVHVLGAGAGILMALARLRRLRLMNASADEVNQSLAPLGLGTAANPTSARPGGNS